MKKNVCVFLLFLLIGVQLFSQSVVISDDAAYLTADNSAVLDINSATKGLLIPRMTSADRIAIGTPAEGLIVYDKTDENYFIYTANGWRLMQEGFWLFNSSTGDVYLEDTTYKVGIGTKSPDAKLSVFADNKMGADEALFEVKNQDGRTVFAVYNNGVRVYIDDDESSKAGSPGGFAVKGISNSKANIDYFWVTRDSIRAYIDTSQVGSPGGFAVKGVSNSAKGTAEEFFRVTRDSTRVYVNTDNSKAGSPGGFAIKGLSNSKAGNSTRFLHLVPNNYFIGHQSGIDITTGLYNSILGYQSARNLTEGNNNTFLGYQAGFSDTTGNDNTFLGYMAGYGNTNASSNVAIGKNAGKMNKDGEANVLIGNNVASGSLNLGNWNVIVGSNSATHPDFVGISNIMIGSDVGGSTTTGAFNVFIGDAVGTANSTGDNNIFIGAHSGTMNTIAENNIFIGSSSGYFNREGNYNVFLGYKSGYKNTLGNNNLFLGYEAGYENTIGSANTFIGYQSGHSNTIGDYNLFLGYLSGEANTTGTDNLFIGSFSGRLNTTSGNNTFIGHYTGFSNTDGENNMFIGPSAGYSNTTGDYNHFIGKNAGYSNTSGRDNLFIGDEAGRRNTIGSYNMFIGSQAGNANKTGSHNMIMGFMSGPVLDGADNNILIGEYTGYSMTSGFQNLIIGVSAGSTLETGGRNILIGTQAGESLVAGSDNVFIGNNAGKNETGSNKLIIDCSDTPTPLIFGDFNTRSLTVNGTFTFNIPANSITLPTTRGGAGQVLTTNGDGTTNWSNGGVLASNGLNLNGNTVEMGGTLTKNTTIDQGNYSMVYNLIGTGAFEIQDNATPAFYVKNDGIIGIGTNTPATNTLMHILQSGTPLVSQFAGTVACFQQNDAVGNWARISIIGGNSGASVIDFGDADLQNAGHIKYKHSDNSMLFQTNGAERISINNTGDLNLSSGTNGGEINRTQTGAANLVPIAYGNIASNGIINTGTGNISVISHTTGEYEIKISGESYFYSQYITNVTIVSGNLIANASSVNNNLYISIKDPSGTLTDAIFSFIVYKP